MAQSDDTKAAAYPEANLPPGVGFNQPATGSRADFMVWECDGPAGPRTVIYIRKVLASGQIFETVDYVDDGLTAIPFVGNNIFVALHGTKQGGGNWPDVAFLYGVTPDGRLVICFPDEEFAKLYRTAIDQGNDQTIIFYPPAGAEAGRRYCWSGTDWTQGTHPDACDPAHLGRLIAPRLEPGPIVFIPR